MSIPTHVQNLLDLFRFCGEAAYPVGGCVRDTLMGIPPHDWDVAVTTSPDATVSICEEAGFHTIPTGIKHGTVTVLVPHSGIPSHREGGYDLIECTTCRTEGGYSDGRRPDGVTFTGRITDDLSRRDFTVNAMAFDTSLGEEEGHPGVLDLFGGREDLRNRLIRTVGDPDTRFCEDGLRLLRAVRFAVKLGFALEDSTRAAIIRRAEGLDRISRERISDEFQKILTSPHPEVGVTLLGELGLLPYVLPCGISPKGAGNLSALPADFILRMACLQWGMDGEALEENLRGLRLPTAVSKQIRTLARRWLLPSRLTSRKAREWRHALGELAAPTLEVRLAAMGAEETGEREMLLSLLELVRRSEEAGEPVRIADLAISGDDLIELGFKPGRLLQDIFCDLLEVVWDHPEKNNRETLLQEAIRRRD